MISLSIFKPRYPIHSWSFMFPNSALWLFPEVHASTTLSSNEFHLLQINFWWTSKAANF
jgi:hypothetical protein